eukprot:4491028-Pyramimonas_sp.AAC.1
MSESPDFGGDQDEGPEEPKEPEEPQQGEELCGTDEEWTHDRQPAYTPPRWHKKGRHFFNPSEDGSEVAPPVNIPAKQQESPAK